MSIRSRAIVSLAFVLLTIAACNSLPPPSLPGISQQVGHSHSDATEPDREVVRPRAEMAGEGGAGGAGNTASGTLVIPFVAQGTAI